MRNTCLTSGMFFVCAFYKAACLIAGTPYMLVPYKICFIAGTPFLCALSLECPPCVPYRWNAFHLCLIRRHMPYRWYAFYLCLTWRRALSLECPSLVPCKARLIAGTPFVGALYRWNYKAACLISGTPFMCAY